MPFVPIILGLASVAGALMEANGVKKVNPAWLEENFGANAFTKEFNNQLASLQASPYGQQLFNEAHTAGQQIANTIRERATASGFGGAEGVQSGGSLFATSTGDQAVSSLRRQANAALSQQAAQQAQATLDRKFQALYPDQVGPNAMGKFGKALGTAAGIGMGAYMQGQGGGKTGTDKTNVTNTGTTGGTTQTGTTAPAGGATQNAAAPTPPPGSTAAAATTRTTVADRFSMSPPSMLYDRRPLLPPQSPVSFAPKGEMLFSGGNPGNVTRFGLRFNFPRPSRVG